MITIRLIIVDDEPTAIEVLINHLQSEPHIMIDRVFNRISDVWRYEALHQADVILLDIRVYNGNGIDLARQLKAVYPNIQIIFVTAHDQYAVDAFELEAIDYLLKPIRKERLLLALRKVKEQAINSVMCSVHTLGSTYVLTHQQVLVKWRTRKVKELFYYLWYAERPMLNSVIAEQLWPHLGRDKAMSNLHTTVYQLRKMIIEYELTGDVLHINNHYALQMNVASDCQQVKQLLAKETWTETDILALLKHYHGDFLMDEDYDWAGNERIHLRQQVTDVLLQQYSLYSGTTAVICLQKLLELDGYNITYIEGLIKVLLTQNNRKQAYQIFQQYDEKLQEIGQQLPVSLLETITHF